MNTRPWRALAADYDGTLANRGTIDPPTLAALRRWTASGRTAILVTGRRWEELREICPEVGLFVRVVAENGGVLVDPASGEIRLLTTPPPEPLVAAVRTLDLRPLAIGRTLIAFRTPDDIPVQAAIDRLGLDYRIVPNKRERMALPAGVDKRTGLLAALDALQIPAEAVVGAGDAENDIPFLTMCGESLAVANALPAVKAAARVVLDRDHGAGVTDWIDRALGTGPGPTRPT